MMMRVSLSTLLCLGLLAGPTTAQQPKAKTADNAAQKPKAEGADNAAEALSLALPTGDRATSNLLVEATAPNRVAVGKTFDYQIKLTNLSKNLVLENIVVRQDLGEHLAIDHSEPKSGKSDKKGAESWSVDRLAPGESKTIQIQALGEDVGSAANCIRVSYQPSLCFTTEFVKPEIQVTKEAPAQANICEVIPARYVVTNTGTGPAKGVVLRDELPEGLTTADGAKVVEANLGDIPQGESKEHKVELAAAKPGDYGSRAVANGEDDLSATSKKTTTAFRAAEINVAIVGPDAVYLDQPSTYRVTVKNTGEAPAVGTKLVVQTDPNLRIDRVSKSTSADKAPDASTEGQLTWELGDLAPNAESVVSFTGVGKGAEAMEHTATATALCARSEDLAATATTVTQTEIISLPALRLEMIDDHDPVQVGENVTYSINVKNQGQGDDRNVQVVVKLPEGLTHVSNEGSSNGKVDGQTITFEPVAKLSPKEHLDYSVVAKAEKVGDVRTTVELTSDYLTTPAPEVEPTRLIEAVSTGTENQ